MWFVNPFQHPEKGWVTGASIRASLGDFSGVIKCPSKYAARMAQAFTATDPSVAIRRDQWEEVADLGDEPYIFTDGVGTISKELGDMIWGALCEGRDENYRRNIQPSAVRYHPTRSSGAIINAALVPNTILGYVRTSNALHATYRFDTSEKASKVWW